MLSWRDCGKRFGIEWKDSQSAAYDQWVALERKRMLLFFPTGEGKSKTSLALLRAEGYTTAVVIAPPKTHPDWKADAAKLGMDVVLHSHAKFRMKDTKYSKAHPFLVDEFHLLGGHDGNGWKKFNRMMSSFDKAVVMLSATPNYNDAERVFCLTAIGDDLPSRNYMDWLVDNCEVKANRFAYYPEVLGFKMYDSAIDFLRSRPWVAYIEDTAVWTPDTLMLPDTSKYVRELWWLGLNRRKMKLTGSDMEDIHTDVDLRYIDDDGVLRLEVFNAMLDKMDQYPDRDKWLIFCNHKTVANALAKAFEKWAEDWNIALITGDSKEREVQFMRDIFVLAPKDAILIGTTALATGVDGLDKVCQSMLILDDIRGDDALRRQLIGRILPRGKADDRERIVITATFGA